MSLKDSLNKTNLDRKTNSNPLLTTNVRFDKTIAFEKTKLDLENKEPNGGAPINVPDNNHKQNYTPTNTYLDKYQEERSYNSEFGTEGDTIKDNNIFKKTNLDIERQTNLGGPINTKSTRHATGFVHKYLPKSPYLNPGDLTDQELEGLIE